MAARPAVRADGPRPARAPAGLASTAVHPGVITGIVRGTGGAALSAACVTATGPAGATMAMSRPDGRYVLTGLRPGRYTLHYSDCAEPGRYFDQWSGGAIWPANAAAVSIGSGQVRDIAPVTLRPTNPAASPGATSGAVLSLTLGVSGRPQLGTAASRPGTGSISGTVTGHGQPLRGICALAVPVRSGTLRFVKTSKTGRYRIGSLKPGQYRVEFTGGLGFCGGNGNWLTQWYRGITTQFEPAKAAHLRVTAGRNTVGIDARMRLGGEIAGTVRSVSDRPLRRICVEVLARETHGFFFGYSLRTGRNGGYAAHALFKGRYFLDFSLGCGNKGNYAPQWWRHATTLAHATPIRISGSRVREANVTLATGGSISGVVRAGSSAGKRLGGICVFAESSSGFFARAVTARNGSYKLIGLTTARYLVQFQPGCGNHGNYLGVRRSLKIRTGHAISEFNTFLPPGAIISGKVTDTHGTAVGRICVQVQGPRGQFGGTESGKDGSYSIAALRSGSYTVEFSGGCGNKGSVAPQYYDGQANSASASPVTLTAGRVTAGINATMQPGATITGVVTGAAGRKLSNVCVGLTAVSQQQFFFFRNIEFTSDGVFTAQNLTPGAYVVNFGCIFGGGRYGSQWFMSQPSASAADLVSATAGVITTGISAVLRRSGAISGVVTNALGKPLSGICVQAIPTGSQPAAVIGPSIDYLTRKGDYTINGLAAGSYDVQFSDCSKGRYGSQWYPSKATARSATPVTVLPGSTVTGISAVMAVGGSISGRVASNSNQPLARICVDADDGTTRSTGFASTNQTGGYSITGLSTGSYQVSFSHCAGKPGLAASTRPDLVEVTAPNAVAGINERMQPSGSISGRVLAGSPVATPQAGVCVVAVPVSPGGSIAFALTGAGGRYRATSLEAGKYEVYFGDPYCPVFETTAPTLAPQWYLDQPAQATANPVTVVARANTDAISATLAPAVGISGTVTGPSSTPVAGECVTAVPVDATADPLFGATQQPEIAVTTTNGSYSEIGLPPGQYKVEFSVGCGDAGFQTQWWDDAASAQTATVITVPTGPPVGGVNAALEH